MPIELGREPASHYGRLAAELRRRIYGGDWKAGMEMPSEAMLSAQYKVSGPVVNRALRELAAEGLVSVTRGRRSVVLRRKSCRAVVEVSAPAAAVAAGLPEAVGAELAAGAAEDPAVSDAGMEVAGDGVRFTMAVDAATPGLASYRAEGLVRRAIEGQPGWDITSARAEVEPEQA